MLAGHQVADGFVLRHDEIEELHQPSSQAGGVVAVVARGQYGDALRLQHGVGLAGGQPHQPALRAGGGTHIPIAGIGQVPDGQDRRQVADQISLHVRLPAEPVTGAGEGFVQL